MNKRRRLPFLGVVLVCFGSACASEVAAGESEEELLSTEAALAVSTGKLFFTEIGASRIRTVSPTGTGAATVSTGLSGAACVAADSAAKKLYWTENGTDAVFRSNYDGSSKTRIYQNTNVLANPEGIAIDVVAKKLFFAEQGAGLIRSMNLDGSSVKVIASGYSAPTGVAVDTVSRRVYFTNNGTDTVVRMNYDGSSAQVIYKNTDVMANPWGIAVDPTAKTLFFTEIGAARIRAANLDGSNVRNVTSSLASPTHITLDPVGRVLYWTENGSDKVRKAGYDGSSKTTIYTNSDAFSNPWGVTYAN